VSTTEPTPAVARASALLFGHSLGAVHEVVVAVLDVEEITNVLRAHRLDGRKSWSRAVCICGWIGERTDHETHVAAALHVALTGEKP
jgi:hypothetical protein